MKNTKNNTVVIIPAYNEEKNIVNLLNDLKKLNFVDVIVVDDCSTDNTKNIIENYKSTNDDINLIPIYKTKNEGKSKALRDGTKLALKMNYKYVVYMDGDYQHKPKDIPKLFKKMKEKNANAVFGIRKYRHIPHHRKISNFLASLIMSIVISIYSLKFVYFRDIQCGFRVIESKFLDDIYFGDGYSVEHLLALQLVKKGAKITEEYVDIDYHDNAVSHITTKKIIDVGIEVAKFVIFGKPKK